MHEGEYLVQIKFSRHARRRASLYKISESIISDILRSTKLSQGKNEILKKVADFKYPLKIAVQVERDIITVITNYPVKKGRKK